MLIFEPQIAQIFTDYRFGITIREEIRILGLKNALGRGEAALILEPQLDSISQIVGSVPIALIL